MSSDAILAEYKSVRSEIEQLNGQIFLVFGSSLTANLTILGWFFTQQPPKPYILVIGVAVLFFGSLILLIRNRVAHRLALFQRYFIETKIPEIRWSRIYFAPVAGIMRTPNVMLVNPSVPTKTVPEFIAYAKGNPGKVSFASGGTGSGSHMSGELFKMMSGVDIVHVPYRGGGPALNDLLGGQVQVYFNTTVSSIGYIRAGRLRALAVTTATRSDVLPDIPTVGEFIPGFEASSWAGVGAPKNTPPETINRLNKEINAGLADPTMKARLADLGGIILGGSPGNFRTLIAEETEKWAKVIKFAGIKPE
jgi:tripartite-type tricarboxylate transporter receptor subunit TctC